MQTASKLCRARPQPKSKDYTDATRRCPGPDDVSAHKATYERQTSTIVTHSWLCVEKRSLMAGVRRGVRLALDWGDARIGVAACDKDGVLAYPVSTVRAGPEEITDLVVAIGEYEPIEVLVGFPRSLSGGEGPAAGKARERAGRLASAIRVPVRLVDERLTTVTASQRLSQSGKRVKDQRELIDAAAAVAILEQALAFEQSRGIPPGELVSASGGPVIDGPDLPGGSGQERPLQT